MEDCIGCFTTFYRLFKGTLLFIPSNENGEIDPAESLYQLFQVSVNNSEAVWQSSKNSWGGVNGEGRERRCTPRAIFSGFSCVGVLQEAIDDFLMSDGKSIEESGLYKEEGIGEDGIPNMYKNREPRFYQDITYSGKVWQKTDKKIYFIKECLTIILKQI
ncbi:RagB/SusD family nutrient uptake outer membrane protein [Bacteroides fragilis]